MSSGPVLLDGTAVEGDTAYPGPIDSHGAVLEVYGQRDGSPTSVGTLVHLDFASGAFTVYSLGYATVSPDDDRDDEMQILTFHTRPVGGTAVDLGDFAVINGSSINTYGVYRVVTDQSTLGPVISRFGLALYSSYSTSPPPGDYTALGVTVPAVVSPTYIWSATWTSATVQLGQAGQDGDVRADIAVYGPSNSTWYIRGLGQVVLGGAGDIPAERAP